MTLQVGDAAPDFTLPGPPGTDPVTLSDFQGDKNVVLLFFPEGIVGSLRRNGKLPKMLDWE